MKKIYPVLAAIALSVCLGACAVDAGGQLNGDGAGVHTGLKLGSDHHTGLDVNGSAGVGKNGLTADGGFGLSVGGQDLIHLGNTNQ